ncbi:hypothetical protein [Cytobacillus praedii]|uniref:hypothetical protein n=1 Tax=Cytobacillus praedii TaxID=1742358 RepID=UPI002E1EBB15|nr:hypothetical protein [Cytobacillus praedii]
MTNAALVSVKFHLLLETLLGKVDFINKYNLDSLLEDSIVELRLPEGGVHRESLATLLDIELVEFEDNNVKQNEKATEKIFSDSE